MKLTWEEFKFTQLWQTEAGEVFVNYNRRMRPFIRARRGVDETRTFDHTKRGYCLAVGYITEARKEQVDDNS